LDKARELRARQGGQEGAAGNRLIAVTGTVPGENFQPPAVVTPDLRDAQPRVDRELIPRRVGDVRFEDQVRRRFTGDQVYVPLAPHRFDVREVEALVGLEAAREVLALLHQPLVGLPAHVA